jgi:hypothetical protein
LVPEYKAGEGLPFGLITVRKGLESDVLREQKPPEVRRPLQERFVRE